jgi:ribosome-binding factor A
LSKSKLTYQLTNFLTYSHMKSKEQFAEHIAHLAAKFISRESNRTSLITVTRAEINEKKTVCSIFFTVLPDSEERSAEIFMKRSAGDLRTFLQREEGVFRVPHLEMCLDAGDKHRRKIDELSKTLPK